VNFEERYQLQLPLSQREHGTVWKAHDVKLAREVALAVVEADAPDAVGFEARFAKLAVIRNAHLARAFDAGKNGDGDIYASFELAEGVSLQQRMREGPPIKLDLAVRMIVDVLGALEALHGVGIVHGDVEPGNVFVKDATGRVVPKLVGLGLNRSEQRSGRASLDADHIQVLAYTAPEQANGESASVAGDVYATGAILFTLLTGRLPHRGEGVEALRKNIASRHVPALSDVRAELAGPLAEAIDRALAPDPKDRFATAEAFAKVLRTALAKVRNAGAIESIAGAPALADDESDEELSKKRLAPKTPAAALKTKLPGGALPPKGKLPAAKLPAAKLPAAKLPLAKAPPKVAPVEPPDTEREDEGLEEAAAFALAVKEPVDAEKPGEEPEKKLEADPKEISEEDPQEKLESKSAQDLEETSDVETLEKEPEEEDESAPEAATKSATPAEEDEREAPVDAEPEPEALDIDTGEAVAEPAAAEHESTPAETKDIQPATQSAEAERVEELLVASRVDELPKAGLPPWIWGVAAVAAVGLIAIASWASFGGEDEPVAASHDPPAEVTDTDDPAPVIAEDVDEPIDRETFAPDEPAVAEEPAVEEPPPVVLTLNGVPDGARVTIDGEEQTGTRVELDPTDAERTIEVSLDGHTPWTQTVAGGESAELDVELEPIGQVAQARRPRRPRPARPARPARPRERPTVVSNPGF
jgi:hypothetical protein